MSTIKDVAQHAGVSVATISRFFSHPEKLSEKRRDQVRAAIEELHYTPNILARNLIKSSSKTVMMLLPSITSNFGASVVASADRVALMRGYSTLIGQTNLSMEAEAQFISRLKSKQADGFLQFSSNVHPEMLDAKNTIPFVNVLECKPNATYPTVQVDDFQASRDITNYLISLGHKKIAALVGLFTDEYRSPVTANRLEGYRSALKSHNLEQPESYFLQGDYSLASGIKAAEKITTMPVSDRPTAIFCASDSMAIGLIRGLKDAGIRCPEDISITGFDDIDLAEYYDPSITTIRQPAVKIGETAMNLLLDMIEDKKVSNKNIFLPHNIIVRGSTRAL